MLVVAGMFDVALVPVVFRGSSRKDRSGDLQVSDDHVSRQDKQGDLAPLLNNLHGNESESS